MPNVKIGNIITLGNWQLFWVHLRLLSSKIMLGSLVEYHIKHKIKVHCSVGRYTGTTIVLSQLYSQ